MKNFLRKGFTLTELLIVLTILLFLILLGIGIFRGQQLKGNDARKKSDIHKISVALEEYEKDHDCYPLPSLVTCQPGDGLQPYIDKIPCDPVTKASYYYEYDDSACPSWYKIYTTIETESDEDIKGTFGIGGAFNYYGGSSNAPAGDITVHATATPTPTQGDEGEGGGEQFYGCFSGVCTPINWDSNRPGPVCDPNFQNPSCYGQCSGGANECTTWH